MTLISVAVTGMHLPARIKIGTPAQRQESAAVRTAANVPVFEPAATPLTSEYPSYCPRIVCSGVSGSSTLTSCDFASRHASRPVPSGGSASTVART